MKKFMTICALIVFSVQIVSAKPRVTLMAGDFQSKGDNRYGAYFREAVIKRLERFPDIAITSSKVTQEVINLSEESQLGKYREKKMKPLSVDYIISGEYSIDGRGIHLIAFISPADTAERLASASIEGSTDDLEKAARDVIDKLRDELKKNRRGILDAVKPDPGQKKARSSKAIEFYSRGLDVNRQKEPRKAYEYFSDAVNLDPEYVDALIELADTCNDFLSRYSDAEKYIEEAEKILQRSNERRSVTYSRVLQIKGSIASNRSSLKSAVDAYNSALSLLTALGKGDSLEASEVLNDLGVVLRKMGQYGAALESYGRALRIKEQLRQGTSLRSAQILHNMAVVYDTQKNYDRSMEYYKKSMRMKSDMGLGVSKTYAVSLISEGALYIRKGQPEDAMLRAKSARDMLSDLGLKKTREYAMACNLEGFAFLKKGDFKNARSSYEEAQELREKLGLERTVEYALSCMDLGKVLLNNLNQPCKALPWIKKGMEIKREAGSDVSGADEILAAEAQSRCPQ